MTIRTTLLAGFALLALSLGGCAAGVGEQQVNLQYPPRPDAGATGKPAEAAMPATGAAPVIALVRFRDVRAEKAVLGVVRNTAGMRTDNVTTPTDISAWVSDALKWELEQAGYRVTLLNNNRAAQGAGAAATVSGTIVHMSADDYFFNEGEVILRTAIATTGGKTVNGQYTGTAGGRFKYTATATDFADTLSLALHDALQDMVADITRNVGK